MNNPYKEHIKQIAGDEAVISISEMGWRELLPTTIETYKALMKELQSPIAVVQVITELVAMMRLMGADISDDKIRAIEGELLYYLHPPKPRKEPKFS